MWADIRQQRCHWRSADSFYSAPGVSGPSVSAVGEICRVLGHAAGIASNEAPTAVSVVLGVFAMGWQSLVMNFMQLGCSRFKRNKDQTQQGDTSGNQPTRKQNKRKTTRRLYNRLM